MEETTFVHIQVCPHFIFNSLCVFKLCANFHVKFVAKLSSTDSFVGHRGFARFSRAGPQPHFGFRDNLQEAMKRSDAEEKDKQIVPVIRFYEPRLGRVQKRNSN